MSAGASYPPDPHVLRDLAFDTENIGARTLVRAEGRAPMAVDDAVGVGTLAILLDVAGAGTAIRAVQPDWIATVDLTYHGGPVPLGPVLIDIAPLRIGSKLVVMEASVQAGSDEPDPDRQVGLGMVTFARIPGSVTEVTADSREGREALRPAEPLTEPLTDRLGIDILDASAGRLSMPHQDYSRNSFGTINGGVVALLAEAAGRARADHESGRTGATHGLEVHYLAQTRTGPAVTETSVVRSDTSGTTVRVALTDAGDDHELLAVAMVSVRR